MTKLFEQDYFHMLFGLVMEMILNTRVTLVPFTLRDCPPASQNYYFSFFGDIEQHQFLSILA